MSAYLQMGHNTENLVGEADLEAFKGIVLSPVNRGPDALRDNMVRFRGAGQFDIVLDPQLYCPRGQRENLEGQPYFPSEFDSIDFSVPEGWGSVVDRLADFASSLGVDYVSSPVSIPRRWTDDFYGVAVETSHMLAERLKGSKTRVLTTCLVSLKDMENESRAMQIGSILTRYDTDGFYLVLESDVEPRREIADAAGLISLLKLVMALKNVAPVTVSYSSSDMILYKAAGAANCCTSKFFNLRRFTQSRFNEPPSGGGGQLPYWFEHNLLSFLREADVKRIQRNGHADMIGGMHSDNRAGLMILEAFSDNRSEPWVGQSWRQYLSWFSKTEKHVSECGMSCVREWLRTAEQNWQVLNAEDLLMDEPANDGSWIRPWRQSLREIFTA